MKGTTTATTISLAGLTAGADYIMSVKARDAVNNTSAASTPLKVSTLSTNLGVTPQSGTATGYRWSANSSALVDSNKYAAAGINDGNLLVSVELNTSFWDFTGAYEAAGIIWSVAQTNINKVSFINGDLNQYNMANFTANLTLQYTTNGTTWQQTGWTVSPVYSYTSSAVNTTFSFSGTTIPSCLGLRVCGQVRTVDGNGYSFEASVKEVQVFFGAAPTGYRWAANTTATSNANRNAAPGINDGNITTSVELNTSYWDFANAYEAAGIVWPAAQQNINRVDFINGSLNQYSNGNFTANLSLQFSTDGTTWTASNWTISPTYPYSASAANNTYTFSGTAISNIKGVRIVGQVRTTGKSSFEASVKEVLVYYAEILARGAIKAVAPISTIPSVNSLLEVCPNPAHQTITVYTKDANCQILISTMNGVIVRRVHSTSTRTLIDVRNLSAGGYSVTVQDSNNNKLSKKLIIFR